MGVAGGPDMIENGLVLSLDASDRNSYVSGSTTWYDLSGNNSNFTLYNGVSYTSSFGGLLSFDGTNDYARSINTIDLSSYDAVTVHVIARGSTNTSSWGALLYEHSDNWNNNQGGFGLSLNTNGFVASSSFAHFFWNTNGGTSGGARNLGPVNLSSSLFFETKTLIKNNADGLRDYYNSTRLAYANSPWGSGSSSLGNTTNFRNDYFYLASRGGTTAFNNADIAAIYVYNRVLTQDEITQNYNAQKSRFGLT